MYRLDQHGFLEDFLAWDKKFALEQLEQLDIELIFTNKHWQSLEILRNFHSEFARHPSMRILIKLLKQKELVNNTLELHELFGPKDLLRTMSLLAGLPKPPHCI